MVNHEHFMSFLNSLQRYPIIRENCRPDKIRFRLTSNKCFHDVVTPDKVLKARATWKEKGTLD